MSLDLDKGVSSVVKGSLGFVGEFKQFISRGNVVDLAVGVIIGGAFGSIVNSLVKDVVMPPIGWLTSGINFDSLKYTIPGTQPYHTENGGGPSSTAPACRFPTVRSSIRSSPS